MVTINIWSDGLIVSRTPFFQQKEIAVNNSIVLAFLYPRNKL